MGHLLAWCRAGLSVLWTEVGATLNVATQTNWDAITPEYWDRAVMSEADRSSLVSVLTGPDGSDAVLLEKDDLTKEPGDKITFSTLQRLLGKGVSGTTALEAAEEKLVPGTFNVSVTLYRHATAADDVARTVTLIKWPSMAAKRIGDWLSRRMDDDVTNQLLNTDTIQTLYGGGKASRATVGPGDSLDPNELTRLNLAGDRRGVKPFRTVKGGKLPFHVYAAIMSEVDYYNLISSDDFKQDVRLAEIRSSDNPALTDRIDMYKGAIIIRWASVNPGDGMLGSYLRPEARVAATFNSSVTTFTIGPTSAVTNVDYGQYFPTGATTHTLLVDSEEITYTGGASDPGDSSWGTVDRAEGGTTAASHTAGALVTLNNIGKVLLLGQNAGLRAWAMRPKRITQERDYGMEAGLGIKWVYGVKGVENADDTLANAVALEVYSANPNTV